MKNKTFKRNTPMTIRSVSREDLPFSVIAMSETTKQSQRLKAEIASLHSQWQSCAANNSRDTPTTKFQFTPT